MTDPFGSVLGSTRGSANAESAPDHPQLALVINGHRVTAHLRGSGDAAYVEFTGDDKQTLPMRLPALTLTRHASTLAGGVLLDPALGLRLDADLVKQLAAWVNAERPELAPPVLCGMCGSTTRWRCGRLGCA